MLMNLMSDDLLFDLQLYKGDILLCWSSKL